MVRLGYACINSTLAKKGVCCNRTCILKTLSSKSDPFEFLIMKSKENLSALVKILQWNRENGIFFYRCSSSMFPHISNKKIIPIIGEENLMKYARLEPFLQELKEIKKIKGKMRLSMHPGQFCQLASPKREVVQNAILDLEWHARFLDLVGNSESTICIHGGGTWGDKKSALERLEKELFLLPDYILSKLCLENCEKSWSAEELLPICESVCIPLIFDFHHYNCYSGVQQPIDKLLPRILASWGDRRPKFHLSDQDPKKKLGAHHDYVSRIPKELIGKKGYDLMIEAKAKELAVFVLKKKYF